MLNLYGVGNGATYTNPKELKGRLLFTRDTFFIFQNFTLKIKFIFVLKLINKSHNISHLLLSHNTQCLPLRNLCISFVFYSFWVVFDLVPREITDNAYTKFWGANKMYYL